MDSPTQQDQPKDQGGGLGKLVQQQLTIPFPETFIYSNVSAYSASMMDMHISFAEALPDRTVVPRVGIVMTPEHAAHVALSLLQQLKFYESQFGAIRNPEWLAYKMRALADLPGTPAPATAQEQQPSEK
ncbi:MAG: DUF3467 domain-containing protein [Bryobacteraceae bacterium]